MSIQIPDLINGLFEVFGGAAVLGHCWQLLKDKQVKGVNMLSCFFFTAWGYWNLFYYPHLNQWLSFAGGILIVLGNTLWLGLIIKYKRLEKQRMRILLPLVRKIIPSTIAQDIIGVQPMSQEAASIFTLKPIYSKDIPVADPNNTIFKDYNND